MEVHYQLYKREIVEDWCCIFTKLVFMLKQKANVESIVGNESGFIIWLSKYFPPLMAALLYMPGRLR